MPVLLMAHGDAASRNMLKHAIIKRYATRPPTVDSVKIIYRGYLNARPGPKPKWIPLKATAYLKTSGAMRWELEAKPPKAPARTLIESYDGEHLLTQQNDDTIRLVSDEERIRSIQQRTWAMKAMLLTPLCEHWVKLQQVGSLAFRAENLVLQTAVTIHLKPDFGIKQLYVDCVNPRSKQRERYIIEIGADLVTIDGLILPKVMLAFWNDLPWFELTPVKVDTHSNISPGTFTLGREFARA